MSRTVVVLLLIPIALSIGQLLFKAASQTTSTLSVTSILSLFLNPWFLSALLLYGVATIAWVFLLQSVPVSRAYPFMSLSFIVVPIGAWLAFGELLDARQLLGMGIIVGGIVIGNS